MQLVLLQTTKNKIMELQSMPRKHHYRKSRKVLAVLKIFQRRQIQ
jgi:hypothetical protein